MNEPKRGDKIGEWTVIRVEEEENFYLLHVERYVGERYETTVMRRNKTDL